MSLLCRLVSGLEFVLVLWIDDSSKTPALALAADMTKQIGLKALNRRFFNTSGTPCQAAESMGEAIQKALGAHLPVAHVHSRHQPGIEIGIGDPAYACQIVDVFRHGDGTAFHMEIFGAPVSEAKPQGA
jgi:hypothetical protein